MQITNTPPSNRGDGHWFWRAMAWLLELNRPVPERTQDEIAAEIEQNYRWNYVVNALDGLFFLTGMAFMSSATVLPLFVSKLTPSPYALGLLAVISQATWFLPQLFTANAVERLARKKPVVVNLGFFLERVPIFGLIPSAALAVRAPMAALALLFGSLAWHGLGAGIVATSWQDLIARCFPLDRRGRFFGMQTFLGNVGGAVGAVLSVWILNRYAFPINFVYCFTIAAIMVFISWVGLALAREPAQATRLPRISMRQYLATLPQLLRQDLNYRRFLGARLLMALGGMAFGFVTVSAVQRWQIPTGTAGIYTMAYLVGQAIGNLAYGHLADRFGHKLCLELGTAAAVAGYGLAWLAPSPVFFYLVFILLGLVASAVVVSGILVVMEFCEPDRRPTYMGIANSAVGTVTIVAPMIGAVLASRGYGWLFATAATVNLMALLLFHWWVKEPRWAPPVTS